MFRARRSNVVNCLPGPDTTWKPNYPGSDIFSWTEKNKGVAVDLLVMGQLRFSGLATASTQFKDPAYRLELDVDEGTASALRQLLETGPFRGTNGARLPILGHTATFSVKLRSLVETDKPGLTASDPFPFVWNGKGMARRDPLREFSVSDLLLGSTLAVETQMSQISSYTFASSTPIRTGYTMSLGSVFFLGEPDPARASAASTPRRKRPGDELVSPRRNKVAGQRAVFSDDDDD